MPLSALGTVLYSISSSMSPNSLSVAQVGAVAVVDQLAVLDPPMFLRVGRPLGDLLLRFSGDILATSAGHLLRVDVPAVPAGEVPAVEEAVNLKAFGRPPVGQEQRDQQEREANMRRTYTVRREESAANDESVTAETAIGEHGTDPC